MAMALEAKGFGYSSNRTSFLQPRFRVADALLLLCTCSVIAALAFLPGRLP
jgi:energy-coupling factor transporter transmembrane protein EcfT